MAISTVDGAVAGSLPPQDIFKAAFTGEAAGQFHSSFYLAGRPGAATAPSPGLNGAALTSYAGQIPFPAAVGGENVYLAAMEATQAANIGSVTLCDRLWHNSGIVVTTTTAQAITHPGLPARDANGATDGEGIMLALEVSTATTNASAVTTITASYTNQAGTAGRTATIASFPATAVAGTFVPFTLQAGDTGVRSVQSITLGSTLTGGGPIHLVQYRQIATIGVPLANVAATRGIADLVLPRMYDNSVPWLVFGLTGTAAGITDCQVVWTQG